MNNATKLGTQITQLIVEINFYISVIVLISGGILSISGTYSIFEFNEDLYGALDNNLRMIMVYLAVSECFIVGYCIVRKRFQVMIIVGCFLILMIGSMGFYGEINAIEIDSTFTIFFLYTGLSHIIFGFIASIKRDHPERQHFHF
jgi:hypothetical protein